MAQGGRLRECHAPERIGPLAVSGDGAYCVGGGVSGRLYLWEVGSGALAVSALCFSLDGCFIFSGAEDAMASCWGVLEALDCDSGNTLMAGSSAGLTAEWSTGEHTLAVTCIGTSQAGDRLITASLDRTAKMYEAATGEVVLSVLCPSPLRAVCCDANENFLFMGAANGTIYQLDTSAAAAAATMADATAISLGTKRAAAAGGLFGSEDRPGAAAGASLQELVGHQKAVTSLACTVDGSTIVSCAEDGAVRTWHVASRQCLLTVNVASAGLSQVLLVNMPAAMFFSQGLQPSLTLPVAPFKKHIAVTGAGANAPSCPPVVFRGSSGEAISGTVDRYVNGNWDFQ
ncbi:quinon protein alcohol dehydrogenase-like superfamily, partial [Tribonema minus]